jgi:TonB family protein
MRTKALLVSLVCLSACDRSQATKPPSEPVNSRPGCERLDYGWATLSEPTPSASTPSFALLGFTSIDKDMIRRPILENRWATECCYELALQRDPDLEGRLVVQFEIEADGRVGAIEVVDDTLADPLLGRCVIEVGKRLWSFPRPIGGGTITIHYPFVFIRP